MRKDITPYMYMLLLFGPIISIDAFYYYKSMTHETGLGPSACSFFLDHADFLGFFLSRQLKNFVFENCQTQITEQTILIIFYAFKMLISIIIGCVMTIYSLTLAALPNEWLPSCLKRDDDERFSNLVPYVNSHGGFKKQMLKQFLITAASILAFFSHKQFVTVENFGLAANMLSQDMTAVLMAIITFILLMGFSGIAVYFVKLK